MAFFLLSHMRVVPCQIQALVCSCHHRHCSWPVRSGPQLSITSWTQQLFAPGEGSYNLSRQGPGAENTHLLSTLTTALPSEAVDATTSKGRAPPTKPYSCVRAASTSASASWTSTWSREPLCCFFLTQGTRERRGSPGDNACMANSEGSCADHQELRKKAFGASFHNEAPIRDS